MKRLLFAAAACAAVVAGAVEAVPAERVRLQDGWSFRREGEEAFRAVRLPHDWSVELAPEADAPGLAGEGFYPAGRGEYATVLKLTEADCAKNLSLYFEGVYRDAAVSVNGREAGRGPFYGYTWFRIDLNGLVKPGDNRVEVKVDNSAQPNCRWYSGSGIYRNVWLEKRGTEYVVPGTLEVRSFGVSAAAATVRITGVVTNTATKAAREERVDVKVEKPELWCPENPRLYTADFFGERVRYGIRTVAWNTDGFWLNGRMVKLHGACVHHDHGPLGAASYDEAEVRKARQLKAAGFNAVRTSHNPVSERFLDACDELGLIVLDDMFDGWKTPKNKCDYSMRYEEDWARDLSMIVRRDRNHPSVAIWSVGNEVYDSTSPDAPAMGRRMVGLCHRLGPGLPVTMALCGDDAQWRKQDKLACELDIVGYNYKESMTEVDHGLFPKRVMVHTETFPSNLVAVWRDVMSHPYVIGEFVWTGIDYLGEATIGRYYYEGKDPPGEHWEVKAWPWHGAHCGDIDVTGWRKPVSHLRETLWNANAPTYMCVLEPDGWKGRVRTTMWAPVPAWESWTFDGWTGRPVTVEVYTRKPKVRLVLNGRVCAERAVSEATAFTARVTIPYVPGELKAEALDAEGKVAETFTLRTAGAPASVRYTRETIGDLEWVVAEVVDKDGVVCPDAAQDVTFEGDVIATCSADMCDNVPAPSRTRRTWRGRAMAVVRKK